MAGVSSCRGCLRGKTGEIELRPKTFELLFYLTENAGRLISKDELVNAIWRNVIVSDDSLAQCVSELRNALNDSDRRIIKTVPRRGYIFAAAVSGGRVRERTTRRLAAILAADVVGYSRLIGADETGTPMVASRRTPPVARKGAKPAPRLSIVVLPFANLSSDPEQEYFVDAVTDDLTTDLSRISGSFVIARTTTLAYKRKPVDVKQIGHELGVRYVLEGSVRRLAEQVQVNVQLIDAETGAHLWADRFDTDRTNLAKAQSEITGRLARTLNLELVGAAGCQIEQEENPDARDLVIRGRAWGLRPVSQETKQAAQRDFEQALELDPGSVDARAELAFILLSNKGMGWSKSPEQDQARAEQLLDEALERDGNNLRVLFAMGQLRRFQGRLLESQIVLEKAIALDRNHAPAIDQLGLTLIALGQPEAALPNFGKAISLNPLQNQNIFIYYTQVGLCHLLLGHADEAVDFLRRAYAANSRNWFVSETLAVALGFRGDIDEAKAALAESLELKPELNSLAKLHAAAPLSQFYPHPQFAALAEKTWDVGLRRAGLPD